jgi:hypothetical protein
MLLFSDSQIPTLALLILVSWPNPQPERGARRTLFAHAIEILFDLEDGNLIASHTLVED